jgi:hypothetical protein
MASTTPTVSVAQPTLDALQALILQHKDNLTALSTIRAPSFVESSDFRGTTDILYSCVVTLVACIYTALHLNVPTKSGLGHALRSKGKWVFIGLIAPELVLYLAIAQFLQARKLVKALNVRLERNARRRDLEAGKAKDEVGEGKNVPKATHQPLDKPTSGTSGGSISKTKRNDDSGGSRKAKVGRIIFQGSGRL